MMILSVTFVSASIKAPERTSNTTWVEDYADVLTPETEKYIQEYSQHLADDYSACIEVVTVDFVQGNIDEYALAIFNQWKLGDSVLNNGVLLLLSIGDDDYYMMIGRGLENDFPIYDIQNLLDDHLEPYFAEKEYDEGVMAVYKATYDYISEDIYGGSSSGQPEPGGSESYSVYSMLVTVIAFVILMIIIFSIISSIKRAARYYQPEYYYTRPRIRTHRSPYYYVPHTYTTTYHHTPSSSHHSSGSSWSSSGSSWSSGHSSGGHSSFGSGSSFGGSK